MTIANFSIHSSSSSQSFTCLTETATSCFTALRGTSTEDKRWDNWLLQWQTQVQTFRTLVGTMTNTSTDCETIGCYNDKHKYRLWDNWLLQWQTQVQTVRQLVVSMTNTSTDCETMTRTDCETCLLFRLRSWGQFFIQAARIAVFAGFVIQFNFFRSVSPPNNFPA